MKKLVLCVLLVLSSTVFAVDMTEIRQELKDITVFGHTPVSSYSRAREFLMQEIHINRDSQGYFVEDVYCNKIIRKSVGPNRMPNHSIINVEHTWPQSRFNTQRSKTQQKTDLHHLYPTDSRANSRRANHVFADVDGQAPAPNCNNSQVGQPRHSGGTAFEPPADHKGNVARALFYFSVRYDIEISPREEAFLRQWNTMDPVDNVEMARNDKIEQIQGNRNPFIDDAEYADLIEDF